MTTFLQLCKDVCREATVPDGEDAITTVTGNRGKLNRIVNYVRSEWTKLQNRHQSAGQYWRWMRVGFTLTTVADQDRYAFNDSAIVDDLTATQIARFRTWMFNDYDDPAKIYLQSAGKGTETWLTYLDWDSFKYFYDIGSNPSSRPAHITISPQNEIVLGPPPNDVYVIRGDFLRGPQTLTNNDDEPDLPAGFEQVLVWGALSRLGLSDNASEVVTYAQDELSTAMGDLESSQLSEVDMAGPLA